MIQSKKDNVKEELAEIIKTGKDDEVLQFLVKNFSRLPEDMKGIVAISFLKQGLIKSAQKKAHKYQKRKSGIEAFSHIVEKKFNENIKDKDTDTEIKTKT